VPARPRLLGRLALWGTDRGWFEGRAIAASGAAVLTMLAMSILAFLNSIELNRTERVRRAAEQRLHTLVHALDRRNVELGLEMAERRRMEVLAAHQASHDFLTGLPNRMLLLDRLETAIGRAVRHGDAFALFYFDIDNFKPVNDRYGHHAGDELLKELARRLQTAVRAVDTMARIGGDEFAAIIDGPVQPLDAEQLAERVGAAFEPPFRLIVPEQAEFIEVTVGVSVGVALFPGHANDLDTLLNVADLAMYRAKLAGKANGQGKNIAFAT
jgi:diguanylate cyclase (GGDEF)-like protein